MVISCIHSQLLRPSGASYSIACSLTSPVEAENTSTSTSTSRSSSSSFYLNPPRDVKKGQLRSHLVTARDDLLSVWEVRVRGNKRRRHDGLVDSGVESSLQGGEKAELFHLRTHTLFGSITGLERVQTIASSEDSRDRILVSFKDAKLSLMEWNDSLADLITVSIHTYERAPQLSMGLPLNFKPILSLDPGHRCATLLLPNSSLAILPFFQSTSDLDLYDDDYLKGTSTSNDKLSSHLPYSPSFVLSLNSVSKSIVSNNVRDVVFLPGFQRPTLAVLCQEELTWTSSLIDRVDTCSVYMITLDLDLGSSKGGSGHHPILMEKNGLPYDSLYLKACPKSIGGVLLITPSSLIHVDQESNIKGIAVSNWFEHTTKLRLPHWQPPQADEHQERTISTEKDGTIDLQNSTLIFSIDHLEDQSYVASSKGKEVRQNAKFEGNESKDRKTLRPHPSTALLFLADGSTYSVQLKTEGRFLSGLSLFKLSQPRSLLPSSTISVLPSKEMEETYIFCGSLAGDGQLIRIEAGEPTGDPGQDIEMSGSTGGNAAASESLHASQKVEDGMDLDDDLDLYGESSAPSGPAGGGDDLNSTSHPLMSSAFTFPRDYRLVHCDNLPALGSIRDLSIMLVREKDENDEEEVFPLTIAAIGTRDGGGVAYIEPSLASRSKKEMDLDSTHGIWTLESTKDSDEAVVLSSGSESSTISRVDRLGNISDSRPLQDVTLAVSLIDNSVDGDFIRISSKSIELLNRESETLATFSPSSQIISAAVGQTFCSCVLEGGKVIIAQAQSREIKTIDSGDLTSSCSSISIFEDKYSLFRLGSEETATLGEPAKEAGQAPEVENQMDEEEEQVDYGEEDFEEEKPTLQDQNSSEVDKGTSKLDQDFNSFLVVATTQSQLEIYSFPDLKMVWSCATLRFSPAQLEGGEVQDGDERIPSIKVVDTCFSHIGGVPHLTLLFENDLLNVYEASPFSESPSSDLQLTFNKVLSRQLSSSTRTPSPPKGSDAERLGFKLSSFQSFGFSEENSTSSDGLAVLGSSPGWILKPRKGGITFVESNEDGMESFSPLHFRSDDSQSTSRQRFVFSQRGKTYIATLPSYSYDLGLPLRSARVGRTQTKILGHLASGTVVTAALFDTPWALFDSEESTLIKDPASEPAPTYSQSGCLELFADGSAAPIHGFEFESNETVCCMEIVSLKTQSTPSGRKDYIAVGTIVVNGEDRPSRGSTYIFDVVEIVAPPDDPGCRFALKLICKDESKAPVTALADINGYIITVVGQKLFVRSLESDDWMVTVAFLDVSYQVTSVRRLKNFLLLGDVKKSVWFVAFQEEPYRLVVLGKDYNEMDVTTVNFLVQESELGFLSCGTDGVLRLLEYGPNVPTSQSGQKLLLRTEFQSAGTVSSSLVIPGKPSNENEPSLNSEVVLSLTNGSLEAVVPIPSLLFNRLQLLQGSLVRSVQHTAGLNPRAFRAVRNETVPRSLTKGILDGTLLQSFEALSRPQMVELSRSLPGCDGPDQILRELIQVRSGFSSI